MSKLELFLLGRFECLQSSGTRVALSMRKAEVLLAFLAIAPGIRHPRERLINLLWSDRGDEQARNSLRQALSSIKKSLGEDADLVLQVDRTTVSLKPELIEVDAHEFERLATVGDYEALTSAADLYQGEFLAGIAIRDAACQEWLDSERQRFRRQFIEILSNLAETQLLSHDYGHAIGSAERLVEQDRLGEAHWRLLMRAYADNGDRSHALQAFKRCRQALRDELEVEPESATIELRDRIAGGQAEPAPAAPPPQKIATPNPGETDHSIAVLPFDNLSGDPEQEYFSDGITDSIILNLALFPGLNVKSRNSSFAFKEQIKSLGEISQELGVDYIVEGSIRKSDQRVRITAQLIEGASGNQIWGKRYDADLADLLSLEEELSRAIAVTVTGRIESDLQRIAIAKGATGQEAYDLLLCGTYYVQRFNRQDTVIAIDKLNQCLARDPDNVRAHVMLCASHIMDYLGRWTEDYRDSLRLAEKHIRRALELDPESGLVHAYYGEFLNFSGDLEAAAKHIDKALAINPNDSNAMAVHALNLDLRGDFEAGLEAAEMAVSLDPHHPWAEWEVAGSQYMCARYRDALDTIAKLRTSPGFIDLFIVAAHIKLGQFDQARQAVQDFLKACREDMLSMPQTVDEWLQYTRENYPYEDESINRDLIDCLVQAGLEDALTPAASPDDAGEMPSIAVLPFENVSGDAEQEYFSDGITTSIILSLGLYQGLRVKSQNSSFAFKNSGKSSEEIAEELKVAYLVEGSVRKSRDRIRISVQLIGADSGNQVWGKQYDAELQDLLELEQELSQSIAATISGRIGHTLQQSAARKPAKNLQSYDYLMRGLYHFGKFTADDLNIAKREIANCLEIDPQNATAHINLGMIHMVDLIEGWATDRTDSKSGASHHVKQALDIEPDNALVQAYAAEYFLELKQYQQSEFHADRAIELNPNAAEGYTVKADLLAFTRRIDEAVKYADKSMQLDPHSVGSGWVAGSVYHLAGMFDKAIKTFRSINHPPASIHALTAVCLVDMGLSEEARREMKLYQEMARRQMTSYPQDANAWRDYWQRYSFYQYDEDFERLFDAMIAAGLCENRVDSSDEMPSIAVLPFENMSDDAEQEHFSDGITSDIIATLSRFKHLRTVSRYSILQYKEQRASIPEIAREQNVRYILEGSVRKSGERIRVSAELIDAADERICWSDRYDRDLDDLFAVQDEITQSIALAMKVHLDDGDMALHRSSGASSVEAWELVMAAVDLQDTYIRENILESRRMAQRAIELDPAYAYAWVCLAWTFWQEVYSGWSESVEAAMEKATRANRKAHELNPNYSEAWSQKGMIHLMNHEPEEAVTACARAVELEPGNAEVQALMAFCFVFTGDLEKARSHEQKVVRLCPMMPNWYFLVSGQIDQFRGDLDSAIQIYVKAIEVEPDSPLGRFYLIQALMEKGDETGARKLAEEIRSLDRAVRGRGLVRSLSGDPEKRDRFRAHLEKFDLY